MLAKIFNYLSGYTVELGNLYYYTWANKWEMGTSHWEANHKVGSRPYKRKVPFMRQNCLARHGNDDNSCTRVMAHRNQSDHNFWQV